MIIYGRAEAERKQASVEAAYNLIRRQTGTEKQYNISTTNENHGDKKYGIL